MLREKSVIQVEIVSIGSGSLLVQEDFSVGSVIGCQHLHSGSAVEDMKWCLGLALEYKTLLGISSSELSL